MTIGAVQQRFQISWWRVWRDRAAAVEARGASPPIDLGARMQAPLAGSHREV
jgi:hypothetical protein